MLALGMKHAAVPPSDYGLAARAPMGSPRR